MQNNKFDFENYDFKRSLLFCGPTWVGKTYKANEMISKYKNEDISEKLQTYTMSDAYFKQMIKSNMLVLRRNEDYACEIKNYPLEMMLRCWVLLYDDLGVSDVSDAYLRDFTFIIDERIKKWLPTIYTTNLTKDELKSKLNERIVSRVLFNTDVVVFTWDDKRLSTTNYFSQ